MRFTVPDRLQILLQISLKQEGTCRCITKTRQCGKDEIKGFVRLGGQLIREILKDMILFIQDGKILDKGTHRELLSRCGEYRELYETENPA